MKERPILFSAPMVRALLAGTKTQTRRVAPVESIDIRDIGDGTISWAAKFSEPVRSRVSGGRATGTYSGGRFTRDQAVSIIAADFCSYGQPGDWLWVREAWRTVRDLDAFSGSEIAEKCVDAGYRKPWAPLQFEADGQRHNWEHTSSPPHDGPPRPGRYRHARFMPRWASRIMLEVTAVRVERLQDISATDAIAEGLSTRLREHDAVCHLLDQYRDLWESINGPESWDANPFVWVVEFKRVTP